MYKIITFENILLYHAIPKYDGNYKDIKDISDQMIHTMIENRGIGLSANQVDIPYRMFVMGDIYRGFWTIINPIIINSSEENMILEEGCLSFPGQRYAVSRPKIIDVMYNDLNGAEVKTQFKDIWARCFLHELDHLNGITFDKIGEKREK